MVGKLRMPVKAFLGSNARRVPTSNCPLLNVAGRDNRLSSKEDLVYRAAERTSMRCFSGKFRAVTAVQQQRWEAADSEQSRNLFGDLIFRRDRFQFFHEQPQFRGDIAPGLLNEGQLNRSVHASQDQGHATRLFRQVID